MAVRYCPNDGHEMEQEDVMGITIDRCTICKGVWLDPGELKAIKERTEDNAADGGMSFATGLCVGMMFP